MSNKQISELSEATVLNDADLGIISQSGVDKKIAGSVLKNADKVDGYHASITAGAYTVPVTGGDSKLGNEWTQASATPTGTTIPIAGSDGKLDIGWIPTIAFSSHKNSSNQTISTGVNTKVTFSTEDYDEGSYYDTANSKFTPVAGKYHIDISLNLLLSVGVNCLVYCMLYKNGTLHKSGITNQATLATTVLSCDVLANGTDYFEVYIYHDGGDKTLDGNQIYTFFQGHKI